MNEKNPLQTRVKDATLTPGNGWANQGKNNKTTKKKPCECCPDSTMVNSPFQPQQEDAIIHQGTSQQATQPAVKPPFQSKEAKAIIGSLSHSSEDLIVTIVYALSNNNSHSWMYYSFIGYGLISFTAETYLAYPEQLAGDCNCPSHNEKVPSPSIRSMIIIGALSLNALRVFNLVNSSGSRDFDRKDPWGEFTSDFQENITIGVVISVLSLISVYFNYKQSLHSLSHLSDSDSFSKTTQRALFISLPNLCATINLLKNMPNNWTGYSVAGLWALSIFLFNAVRQGVEIATSKTMNKQLILPAVIISLFSLMGELPVFGKMTQSDLVWSIGLSMLTALPDNLYHLSFHREQHTALGQFLNRYSEQSSCSTLPWHHAFSPSTSGRTNDLSTRLMEADPDPEIASNSHH